VEVSAECVLTYWMKYNYSNVNSHVMIC
jgi:hypothetical protein